MTNIREGQDSAPLYTQYGTIHVWADPNMGNSKDNPDTIIYFEVDEADGGLTLPSGTNYHSEFKQRHDPWSSLWSTNVGFHNSKLSLAYNLPNGKTDFLSPYSPDATAFSDMFFDFYLSNALPYPPLDPQFTLDRQKTVNAITERMNKVLELNEEIKELANTDNTLIKKHQGKRVIYGGFPRAKTQLY